ncbi:MAG: fibronectin type III domain-containing protein, partial [Butyricicoccaceae bacterium]
MLCLCALLGSAGVIFAAHTEIFSSTQESEMQLVQAETAAPAQPAGLKAVSTGYNSIRFTWDQVSGAEGYFVYRKSGKDSWKKIAQTTSGSYQDSGLTTGTAYTYTVRAYIGSGGERVLSAYDKTGATATPVPAAVKLGKATVSGSSIKITWSKTAGANGYCIYRKNPGGSWKKIKTVGNTTTSYTDQNLKIGTYIYTIRAYRKVGKDTVLGAYDSTGITGSIAPEKPKLSSAAASTSGVTVKWSKVSGANGYRVYRKSGSQSWTKIATVQSASTISYTDAKVNSGVKYTYT